VTQKFASPAKKEKRKQNPVSHVDLDMQGYVCNSVLTGKFGNSQSWIQIS